MSVCTSRSRGIAPAVNLDDLAAERAEPLLHVGHDARLRAYHVTAREPRGLHSTSRFFARVIAT